MNPLLSISSPTLISTYLYPDNITPTDATDWELGGIGLSNSSQGLEVQAWEMVVAGTLGQPGTAIYVSSPNTASTQLLQVDGITFARFTFDQNMKPVVTYVAAGHTYFWWYDATIPGYTTLALPSTAGQAACTLDDKYPLATFTNTNDIILCYVNNNELCFRRQRDRYATEYVWVANLSQYIANPRVNRIGMTENRRLLIDIEGSLYQ